MNVRAGDVKPRSEQAKRRAREKARAHRERQRAKGLKLVQLWVPDRHSPELVERARREALAIASSPDEADDQAFIDAVSELKPE